MRALIFTAGGLTTALAFAAHSQLKDPGMLQGALTLGGGWIICGLFSFSNRWHGIIGAGVLGLLGAARCAPALLQLGKSATAPWETAALLISSVVLVAVVRALTAERARRMREELLKED
ncbi:hypothetical protein [Haloferula sargassicola]|uniref:Uncharacterized protein n=1 Tax=Haloferula sargassicola TaxID=490096 RepID=A0ABP9UJG1_9BACT